MDILKELGIVRTNQDATKHPKCRGFKKETLDGTDYDCGYGTTIACDDCKYLLGGGGRKNPEAKVNQPKISSPS